MKKFAGAAVIAAAAALFSPANPSMAGGFIIFSKPTFTPESSFTNNTIVVDTTASQGAVAHASGGATVTPDASNQVMIEVRGSYFAAPGDALSIAYSFTTDLNSDTPVAYTATGMITIRGIPVLLEGGGTLMPGLNKYEGEFRAGGVFGADSGAFSATVIADFGSAGSPQAVAPGSLSLAIQQVDVKIDPAPATLQLPSQLLNISTRLNVGADDNVLIGGFIITGTDSKTVVLRAIGPSLALVGVTGVLADPLLELHDSTGAPLDSNDNWMDLSSDDQLALDDLLLVPSDNAESALIANLAPGAYTAVVRGVGNTTGVGLVEAYDIDAGTTDSKLANISTRGFVDTGDNVMIGGLILSGGGGGFATVVVRGIGPSLTALGVSGALDDPLLEVHDASGAVVAVNDNWMDDPNMQMVSDAGLAPTDPNESALFMILPQAAYTVILSGANDANPGGVALVEAYNLD